MSNSQAGRLRVGQATPTSGFRAPPAARGRSWPTVTGQAAKTSGMFLVKLMREYTRSMEKYGAPQCVTSAVAAYDPVARTQDVVRLNNTWVEVLMGWPVGWTA